MIVVVNEDFDVMVFHTLELYKVWAISKVKNGTHPDDIITNDVYEVDAKGTLDILDTELTSEKNVIDVFDWHCDLYNLV